MQATGTPTAAVFSPIGTTAGSAIGTAVGVSVSVTFVVSFSLGVLMASVLCYISKRATGTSYKSSSQADPATVYDEVDTNKKMKGDVMDLGANTAYGVAPVVMEMEYEVPVASLS